MTEATDKNWPAWFYGPNGESEIFQHPADVPEGWLDDPNKHGANLSKEPPKGAEPPPLSRGDIMAALKERGIRVDVKLPTKALYDQLVAATPPEVDTVPPITRDEIVAALKERDVEVNDELSDAALFDQLVALVDAES